MEFDCQINNLRYAGFSTGNYSQKGGGAGLCLQFHSEDFRRDYYAIFNAEVTYARNSKKHKAGQRYPGNQFRVSKSYLFYRFWVSLGLKLPPRPSQFHDYMGHLANFSFSGLARLDGKLSNRSLSAMRIDSDFSDFPYNQILEAHFGRQPYIQPPCNDHAFVVQTADTSQTAKPHNDSSECGVYQGIYANTGTCSDNYGVTLEGRKHDVTKEVEDWLNEYIESDEIDSLPF
jgi:hypothetical protein